MMHGHLNVKKKGGYCIVCHQDLSSACLSNQYLFDYSTAFCRVHLIFTGVVLCVCVCVFACLCVCVSSGNLRRDGTLVT